MKDKNAPRVCRQCGKEWPPRTMMASLIGFDADLGRNRTIGVFCGTSNPAQRGCADVFLDEHPGWVAEFFGAKVEAKA